MSEKFWKNFEKYFCIRKSKRKILENIFGSEKSGKKPKKYLWIKKIKKKFEKTFLNQKIR